jgi:hypothetical protein
MLLRFVPYIGERSSPHLVPDDPRSRGRPWLVDAAVDRGSVPRRRAHYCREPGAAAIDEGLDDLTGRRRRGGCLLDVAVGPVGLLFLGRHVDRLEFLDIMLGDQPALTPERISSNACLPTIPTRPRIKPRRF